MSAPVTRMAGAVTVALVALALPGAAGAQRGPGEGFTGTPIVGGGSFNTAPLIEPGRYTDTVVSKETNFYRVRLQKGQRMEVSATVDASAVQDDISAADYDEGLDNQSYRLDLWSPIREPLVDEIEGAGGELEGDEDVGLYSGSASTRIVLGYDEVLASDYNVNKFEGPGDYYIELAALPNDIYDPPRSLAELPVEFELRLTGRAQASSSDFAESLPDAPPDQGGGEPTGPREPADGNASGVLASETGSDSSSLAVIAAFAGLALLTGLGLGALAGLALRRRTAAA
ncbi:MAG: hypothetical protein ACR2F4_04470 [Thermoleophilaceae bacterium]